MILEYIILIVISLIEWVAGSQTIPGRNYKIIPQKAIADSDQYLIVSFMSRDHVTCLFKCNIEPDCFASTHNQDGHCKLYSQIGLNFISNDASSTLYHTFYTINTIQGITSGLTHYWPFNTDINDYIGFSKLTPGSSVETGFGLNRFNSPNSSIYMNNGYFLAPNGVYFDRGPFTISGWVKPIAFNRHSTMLSFGNGPANDNVYLSISNGYTGIPFFGVWNKGTSVAIVFSSVELSIGQWTHLSGVYNGTNLIIYQNGQITAVSGFIGTQMDQNVTRTQCYIGRSNWFPNEEDASAYFDEIRIYNRALSRQEIMANINI